MDKIDRLGWTEGIAFTLYGARIGIRANDADALKQVLERLPPGWRVLESPIVDWLYSLRIGKVTRPGMRPYHLLYSNLTRLVRTHEPQQVWEAFEHDVQLAVAQTARRKVFVHAGVVGWRGRAIVMPGKTFTGKSTLVAALVRAGATYYSDEYAVFDSRGRVHPFARPLSLRDEHLRNHKVAWEVQPGEKPLPVGLILITAYRPGAEWRTRVLTPGLGVLELLANTVAARDRQPFVLDTLARVAHGARILKGARGEAESFAPFVLERLAVS